MRSVCSCAELVYKKQRLNLRRLIQWFRSGGRQVHVSVADIDTINFKFAFIIAMWETGSMFLACHYLGNNKKTRGSLTSDRKGGEILSIHSKTSCLKDVFLAARQTLSILPALFIRQKPVVTLKIQHI
jgi:hypothetical protein